MKTKLLRVASTPYVTKEFLKKGGGTNSARSSVPTTTIWGLAFLKLC